MPSHEDRICVNCGYDLHGLAHRGRCPECGQAYDIFSGEGLSADDTPGRRQPRWVMHLRTIILAVFALVMLACGGLFSMVSQKPMRPVILGGIVAGVFALAALVSFVYEREP